MRTAVVIAAASLASLGACSGDDATPVAEGPAATVADQVAPQTDLAAPTDSTGTVVATSAPATAPAASGAGSIAPTTFPVVEVPESGVPGLDSDDAFCAAWSRFGGSWQVVQVAANFAPDPSIVPAMEVVASPVVTAAYDAMFVAWPPELEVERDTVATDFFGPLERRSEAALAALGTVGATPGDVAAVGDAWVAALAARAPDDPTVVPELPDELWALVDAAAAEFDAQRVAFLDDPSMRITVETPLTDAYLATACPDQGALTGSEVDAG